MIAPIAEFDWEMGMKSTVGRTRIIAACLEWKENYKINIALMNILYVTIPNSLFMEPKSKNLSTTVNK